MRAEYREGERFSRLEFTEEIFYDCDFSDCTFIDCTFENCKLDHSVPVSYTHLTLPTT